VQGAVGFGYAMVVVPALLLVAPVAVPTAPLVVALPMTLFLAFADRQGLDRAGFGRLTAGRIPGTAAGAWVITLLSTRVLAGAVGILLVCAAVTSFLRGRRASSPGLEVVAGFASGVAGTVGAVGGPYMGLAFADRPGYVLRATISAAFVVGTALSLFAVWLTGTLEPEAARLGLALVPATGFGLWAGRRLTKRLDGPLLRPAVLGFAGAAGLFAVLRAAL
jgi:uncharacterized membrane protein YfcA